MLRRRRVWMLGSLGISGFCVGLPSASGSIFQTASPYTDSQGDSVGSANGGRDIVGATITNDATNLYITVETNPTTTTNNSDGVSGAPGNSNNEQPANIATGGSFNYIMGITSGPGAGGDTSANATTHGNGYGRAISIDSTLGGMTDMIGMFGVGGAGAAGTVAAPFTNEGFNDYVWTGTAWAKHGNVSTLALATSQGDSLFASGGDANDNTFTVVVPLSDFASNLALTPGTTIDFDIYSTGTSGNQTAYDSLANQSETQSGTYSSTLQYNSLVLDSYTIIPEPATLAVIGSGALLLVKRRRGRGI
jgi:hypothetical protein